MTALALRLPRVAATGWRAHLLALGLASLAILALRARDAADIAVIWWTSDTYAHCLLIPLILAWLVAERRQALASLQPATWPAALVVPGLGVLLTILGEAAGVATARHLGLVLLLAGTVRVLLGRAAARVLLFPLAYSLFLVPFGEELVPALQLVTARMCMALLGVVGIPAHLEGVFITVPYGWFEVAEACSGVKFLVAMAALAVLVAHLGFRSWPRRIAFVAFALAVPVLANGLRAFGTIWLAQSRGVEAATGVDHLVYGWIFFALVIALTLGAAWPFFDRRADEPITAPPQVSASSPVPALAAAFAIVALAAVPTLWAAAGAQAAQPVPPLAPPVVPGWTRVAGEADPAWRPRFDGADRLVRARYRDGAGAQVDLVLAAYAAQGEGRELVGYGQGALPPNSAWSWSGEGRPVPHGRADRLTATATGREVLSFYHVDGLTTGDPTRVKLVTLRVRLLGRDPAAFALLVSSASPGPPAVSRPAIDRFLAAAGGPDALLPR